MKTTMLFAPAVLAAGFAAPTLAHPAAEVTVGLPPLVLEVGGVTVVLGPQPAAPVYYEPAPVYYEPPPPSVVVIHRRAPVYEREVAYERPIVYDRDDDERYERRGCNAHGRGDRGRHRGWSR